MNIPNNVNLRSAIQLLGGHICCPAYRACFTFSVTKNRLKLLLELTGSFVNEKIGNYLTAGIFFFFLRFL
jgi:hypothetical protein